MGRSKPESSALALARYRARRGLWTAIFAEAQRVYVATRQFELAFCWAAEVGATVYDEEGYALIRSDMRDYRTIYTSVRAFLAQACTSGWCMVPNKNEPMLTRCRTQHWFQDATAKADDAEVHQVTARAFLDILGGKALDIDWALFDPDGRSREFRALIAAVNAAPQGPGAAQQYKTDYNKMLRELMNSRKENS